MIGLDNPPSYVNPLEYYKGRAMFWQFMYFASVVPLIVLLCIITAVSVGDSSSSLTEDNQLKTIPLDRIK